MDYALSFVYLPTTDLEASLAYYRDVLGFDESWREGDDTIGLAVPGSDVSLMLDRVVDDTPGGPGPMFVVDDVAAFLADHAGLELAFGPTEIPDGRVVGFHDPSGNWLYVFDQSGAAQ